MRQYFLGVLGFCVLLSACGTAAATDTAADTADDAASDDAATADSGPDCASDWHPVCVAASPNGFRANPDPLAIQTFPDDWYTVTDSTSKTGLRVHFAADNAPWMGSTPGAFASTYTDLSTLDGWGVNAGIVLRFGSVVMDLPARVTDVDAAPIALWDLDAQPPTKIPYEVQVVDDGTTLILWPMKTLVAKHLHGVIAADQLQPASGGCLAATVALVPLIAPQAPACPSPEVTRLRPAYQKLLTAANVQPEHVAAAVVFTTQSTTDESLAIAADIAKRDIDWSVKPVCQVVNGYRQCDGKFKLTDYTDGRVVQDISKAHISGELDVRVWLPLASTATTLPVYPPVIFGHGLGSDRDQGHELADRAAPEGLATIAIDAVGHGDHPGNDPALKGQKISGILAFFGVDINALSLDALRLRDHWRASTYDKLQLVRLLQQHNDIDGDGKGDLDMPRLTYLGVSLGGIMGPELLAVSPDIHLAVLAVPGGRISAIIADGSIFSVVATVMENALNVTDSDVARFYPVMQALVDRGDSASYGPFILKNRLPGAGAKGTSVLLQMVIADEYVPNAANRALIRAMDLPLMGEILQEVGVVGVAPKAPFKENIAPGVTAAVLQFDRVTRGNGQPPEKAQHGNEPACKEALLQDLHFMHTWLDSEANNPGGGVAEILNPYEVMGTPKLPPPKP
jgi:hypothetical protein